MGFGLRRCVISGPTNPHSCLGFHVTGSLSQNMHRANYYNQLRNGRQASVEKGPLIFCYGLSGRQRAHGTDRKVIELRWGEVGRS